MSKDNIEEMAKDLCECYVDHTAIFDAKATAEKMVTKGYRKQEWISVDERLPEEEGYYLCVLADDIVAPYVLRVQFSNNKFFISEWHEENTGRKVTHWMPLPEPPKMKGGVMG